VEQFVDLPRAQQEAVLALVNKNKEKGGGGGAAAGNGGGAEAMSVDTGGRPSATAAGGVGGHTVESLIQDVEEMQRLH
jgi:hypothetical protein